MSSQDTVPDDTLYQEYQDDTIHQSSGPADPAVINKYSSGKGEAEQLRESAPYKTKVAAHHDTRHQPEENDAKIQRLWGELKDLRAQQKQLSIQEDNVLSRLQEALGYKGEITRSSLIESHKTLRWADSVDNYGPANDTHRANKRARNNS